MLSIEARGFRETLDQLKKIDPEFRKTIFADMRTHAVALQEEARDYIDDEGLDGWKRWRGGYDPGTISGGIKITRAKRRKRGTAISNVIGVENTTAAGVIWELAGRRSNGEPPRMGINPRTGRSYGNGVGFVQAIRRKSGQRASRIVWGAWDSKSGFHIDKAREQLIIAITSATRRVESRLGAN